MSGQSPDDPKRTTAQFLLGLSQGKASDSPTQSTTRGNTDHDPKPEVAKRENALHRGLAAGPSFGGSTPRLAQSVKAPQAPMPSKNTPAGAPVAAKGQEGEKRLFRRLGEPQGPSQTKDKGPEQHNGKKPFRSFGKGDLSKEFDRSR